MAKPIGGILELRVAGEPMTVGGSCTYGLSGWTFESEAGATGAILRTSRRKVPFVEVEIADHLDLDLEALNAVRDETATLRLVNGKVINFGGLYPAGDWEQDAITGRLTVRFEGSTGSEARA